MDNEAYAQGSSREQDGFVPWGCDDGQGILVLWIFTSGQSEFVTWLSVASTPLV